MKIPTSFFILLVIFILIKPSEVFSQDNCETKFEELEQIENYKEKYNKLKDLAEKCPDHMQTFRSLSISLLVYSSELGEDWLHQALEYSQKMLTIDSNYITSQFLYAQTLEYMGEYDKAIFHYQKSIDIGNQTLDDQKIAKMVSESRIHLITCNFLVENFSQEDNNVEQPNIQKQDDFDISDKAIIERAGWNSLKELVATVAVTGSMTALEGNGQHIQYALQLLFDWIDAPTEQKVIERNRFLAGMISTITTIIIEKQLDIKLSDRFDPLTGRTKPLDLPESNYAGEIETDFRDQSPEEGKIYEISDGLTITERSNVPDISGRWKINYTGSAIIIKSGETMPSNSAAIAVIFQDGPNVEINCTNSGKGWKLAGILNGYTITKLEFISYIGQGRSRSSDINFIKNSLVINKSKTQMNNELEYTTGITRWVGSSVWKRE